MGKKGNLTVITHPDDRLKVVSEPVEKFDNALRTFMRQMSEFVSMNGALGLAAVQVGKPIRAMVVTGGRPKSPCFSLVNPIVELSGDDKTENEACLSVPEKSVLVARKYQARVVYQDMHGNTNVWTFFGRMARIVQHELDHLNGILIVDHEEKNV